MFNKRSKSQASLPELDDNVRKITISWYSSDPESKRVISFIITNGYEDVDYQAGCEIYDALVNAGYHVEVTYNYDYKIL